MSVRALDREQRVTCVTKGEMPREERVGREVRRWRFTACTLEEKSRCELGCGLESRQGVAGCGLVHKGKTFGMNRSAHWSESKGLRVVHKGKTLGMNRSADATRSKGRRGVHIGETLSINRYTYLH